MVYGVSVVQVQQQEIPQRAADWPPQWQFRSKTTTNQRNTGSIPACTLL
jgi:hypothetical protein